MLEIGIARCKRLDALLVLKKCAYSFFHPTPYILFILHHPLDFLGVNALPCPAAKEGQKQEEGCFCFNFGIFLPANRLFNHLQVLIIIIVLDQDTINIENTVHVIGKIESHGVGHIEEQKFILVHIHSD